VHGKRDKYYTEGKINVTCKYNGKYILLIIYLNFITDMIEDKLVLMVSWRTIKTS